MRRRRPSSGTRSLRRPSAPHRPDIGAQPPAADRHSRVLGDDQLEGARIALLDLNVAAYPGYHDAVVSSAVGTRTETPLGADSKCWASRPSTSAGAGDDGRHRRRGPAVGPDELEQIRRRRRAPRDQRGVHGRLRRLGGRRGRRSTSCTGRTRQVRHRRRGARVAARRHQGPLLPRLVLGRRYEQYSELVHRLCAREVDGEAEEGVDRGRRPRVGRRPAGARVAVDLRPRRAHGDPRHVQRPAWQLRDGGLRRGFRRRPRHGGGRRSGNGRPRRRPHRGGGLRPRLLDDHEGARRPRVRRHGVFGVALIDGPPQGATRAQFASMYLREKEGVAIPTLSFAATGAACSARMFYHSVEKANALSARANILDDVGEQPYVAQARRTPLTTAPLATRRSPPTARRTWRRTRSPSTSTRSTRGGRCSARTSAARRASTASRS